MNTVMKKLESGKTSVKGTKMLYPISEGCLIEVTVKGLSFEKAECGPSVIISPAAGQGEMSVRCDKLVDDNKESREEYTRRQKYVVFKRQTRFRYLTRIGRVNLLTKLISDLTEGQKQELLKNDPGNFTKDGRVSGSGNDYSYYTLFEQVLVMKFKLDANFRQDD